MATQKFRARIEKHPENASLFFDVPFDPKEAFGQVRAPVTVTIAGFTFRTTIARMGGRTFIGLNKANRDGTGVEAGQRVDVIVASDDAPRTIEPPAELAAALRESKAAQAAWDKLSYTHRKEHVEAIEGAKKPETRARRIAKTIEMLEQKR